MGDSTECRCPLRLTDVFIAALAAFATYLLLERFPLAARFRPPVAALVQSAAFAAAFILPGAVLFRLRGGSALARWMPRERLDRDIVAGLILGLMVAAMNGVAVTVAAGAGSLDPSGWPGTLVWRSRTLADVSMALLAIGFVSPVAEEVLFRGVLYPWMRRWLRAVPAILVTAALFGAVHSAGMRLPAFLLGIVAAIMVEYTGSLVPAALAHIGGNAAFVLFLANGGRLAYMTPLWAMAAAFVLLNIAFLLFGKDIFTRPAERAEDAPSGGGLDVQGQAEADGQEDGVLSEGVPE